MSNDRPETKSFETCGVAQIQNRRISKNVKQQVKNTLETSGEDVENTLETSGKDVEITLETSGEDVKFTLEMSGKDVKITLEMSGRDVGWFFRSRGSRFGF